MSSPSVFASHSKALYARPRIMGWGGGVGGEGVLPYMGPYRYAAPVKGMNFKQFTLG